LANPENVLSPGMFTSIEVLMAEKTKVLLAPITAIQYATYGDSVFVIEEKAEEKAEEKSQEETQQAQASNEEVEKSLVARQQFVRLGETRGDYVVIEKGVTEGDRIVSTGGFKLRNGAPVFINNSVVPDFSLAPVLKDQ